MQKESSQQLNNYNGKICDQFYEKPVNPLKIKLKIIQKHDYFKQGDLYNVKVSKQITPQQVFQIIQNTLSLNPQLCAVYSTYWNKIFYKIKVKCKRLRYHQQCMLYQVMQRQEEGKGGKHKKEDRKGQPWTFKDGKTKV